MHYIYFQDFSLSKYPGQQWEWRRSTGSKCWHVGPWPLPRTRTRPCLGPNERTTRKQWEQFGKHQTQQFQLAREHHAPSSPSTSTTSSSSQCCCCGGYLPWHSLTFPVSYFKDFNFCGISSLLEARTYNLFYMYMWMVHCTGMYFQGNVVASITTPVQYGRPSASRSPRHGELRGFTTSGREAGWGQTQRPFENSDWPTPVL